MVNTPEQFVQAQKLSFDLYQAIALKTLEGFEKLAELNIQAAKTSIEEGAEQMKALMSAKDPKALTDWSATSAQVYSTTLPCPMGCVKYTASGCVVDQCSRQSRRV